MGYDWNGFSASGLGCGSDSGALNVGLYQSLPPGATGLKVKQIAFAIYGTNSLPPFIQLHGSTATPRLSTSSAVQCCGSGCDLAVQVAAAGYSWYNSPCGQAPCGNANKWYYMDFSGTAVGTTEQTGISEATFYNAGGSQIGANMINLGSGSVFFMSYTVIIPSPTPTPSLTKSPVSPSLTASETASTSVSRSVTASGSIDPTDSRSVSASRSTSRTSTTDVTDSRSPSTSMSPSRAPSVTVSPSRAASLTQSQSRTASPVSSSPTPTVTPYLPWFQGLTGCCHNSLDTSVQALNVLTPHPYPNMGINRISIQFWPLTAGTATFTIALMPVAGISFPGASILASKTFSVVSPGSFPTYPQQVATFTDLDPISSYVLGGDVEYVLAFYNATPGIIDLVVGVSSLSPYFWNGLMTESTGSFYTVGETDPTTAFWYQSTNIAFVAVGAGSVTSSSPSISMSRSSSTSISATSSSSPSVTSAVSQSTIATDTSSSSITTTASSSPSTTTSRSQSTSVSESPSLSPSATAAASQSISTSAIDSSSSSATPSGSQSTSLSTTSSRSSSSSITGTSSLSQSNTVSGTTSSGASSSSTITQTVSRSSSVPATESQSADVSTTASTTSSVSITVSASISSSTSSTITQTVSRSSSSDISASQSTSASFSLSITGSVSATSTITQSQSVSTSSHTTYSPSMTVYITSSSSITASLTSSTSITLSPSPQSFQQVNNISTAMSATSTPQFMFTAYPTTSPTYSPTQNATLPIIVVDGQATNMTTTNALIGSTLALIIVAVALAAGRYLPAGWAQRCRRMIPQSTIDNFKRDPLGSVTAMVNDPKSVLKNVNIQIPDSVRSISDMVPQSIKDKIVPKELQEIVGIAPSATVPHIDTESVTPETSPPPPASSRKIDIAPPPPPPPVRREIAPEPIQEEKEQDVKVETVTSVTEDSGVIIVRKDEEDAPPSTILKIDPADLEAVQALLTSRNATHSVIQSNA